MKALMVFIVLCLFIPAIAAEIQNSNEPQKGQWDFNLKKVWAIDKVDGDLLAVVRKIAVDDKGDIYFFDSKLQKFFVVDAAGKFKNSFGKVGEGPGEYKYMIRFFLLKNSLAACDINKVHIFSKEGKPGKVYNDWKRNGITPRGFVDQNRFVKVWDKKIEIINVTTGKSSLVAKTESDNVTIVAGGRAISFISKTHYPYIVVGVKDNYIYYGKNDRYNISKIDLSGKPVMSFGIVGKPRKKLSAAYKDKTMLRFKKNSDAMIKAVRKSLPLEFPYFSRIHVAKDSLIYVFLTNDEIPEAQEIDIFSQSGKYLYRSIIRFPEDQSIISSLCIKGDYLFVFLEDEEGGVSLEKYAIKRPLS